MSSVPPVVLDAWSNLCSNWRCDERRFYEQEYGVDDASEIATADLESCNYKDMRIVADHLNRVCFSLFFFVLVLFCLGARCAPDELRAWVFWG